MHPNTSRVMPRNRPFVVGICVISWSVLLLPVLSSVLANLMESIPNPRALQAAWVSMINRTFHLPPELLPVVTGCVGLGVFVLACASTVELVVYRWGVDSDESDTSA